MILKFVDNRIHKLKNTIHIPFKLDLTDYYDSPELIENDLIYELASICFHEGDGINEGHYTSNK